MHFFLHGGRTDIESENNVLFFQKTCHDGDKILLFPFAMKENERDETCIKYEERRKMHNPDKQLYFSRAETDIPKLIQQIQESDVLFFCGGPFPRWHRDILDVIPDSRKLLQNKIIVGASAWSLIWSTMYYSPRYERISMGNGRLPIKMMVHRWADRHPWLSKEERLKILEECGEKLPIYKIPEQEFIEMEI